MPIATFINMLAVLAGGTLGLILRNKLTENLKKTTFQGLGLVTLVIGLQMALGVNNILLMIFSLIIGGIIGELLQLDKRFEQAGEFLKRKVKSKDERFVEGLTTAFLLFCIGSVTILGALEEGLKGERKLLFMKSVLDGFASIALTAVYGVGVMFSVIPMLILQGGLTVLAFYLQDFFSEAVVQEMSAVGGVLILGLGINLLEIKEIRVNNMLPALLMIVVLVLLTQTLNL